jgi:F-type H+-transporting ATPase subunit alpha
MAKNTTLIEQLQQNISSFSPQVKPVSSGTVVQMGDGIAKVSGLQDVMLGELVQFPQNTLGLTLNLNTDSIGVIILGDDKHLKEGDTVAGTGRLLTIGVSDDIIGRVVDPLGVALDGKPAIIPKSFMPLDKVAPGVLDRAPVTQPVQTGVKAVDSMIPIGRGQRELIIGDRSTGKTAVALSSIINAKGDNLICIYVSIGQKRSSVAQTIGVLEANGCFAYSLIVSASASDPASMQYLAPYAGTAIAEYFAAQGKDVLVVYDDLTKHAWAYREVSLLLRRPSGREAYPGDVFYLHSRLLERSVKLSKAMGGGSITSLPIIETQAGDVSAYIPTNVISITDGQIFLDADMFNAGQRPAINLGISVSRVGGAAQIKAMKQVVGTMKLDMAQYRDLAAFAQFSSDLDPKTKAQIERGQRITEVLKQGWDEPYKVEEQIAVFWAINSGFINTVKLDRVKEWELGYLNYLRTHHAKVLKQIAQEKVLSPEIDKSLTEIIEKYNHTQSDLLVEA